MDFTEVRTPAFLVDIDKVKKNCENMIDRCKKAGVALRPHMKTHKTLEAAKYMTGGSQRCIVVSTLSGAEFFANAGYDDIMYAYPLTPDKVQMAAQLVVKLQKFHVFIDNEVILKALVSYKLPKGKKWSVFLLVDCGFYREGLMFNDPYCIQLTQAIASEDCMDFSGLYHHCGNSYKATGEDNIREGGAITRDRILTLASRLKDAGINCPVIGLGSTPNCSKPVHDAKGITEFHPGNYVFYDYQQFLIGSCSMDDIAVRVLTRVIGHYPGTGQLLIDCGFTALSHDGMTRLPDKAFCLIEGHPNLKLVSMCQEIGTVKAVEGQSLDLTNYPIGSFLKIIPYHSCATACMHPKYLIYRQNDEKIIDQWTPNRGW